MRILIAIAAIAMLPGCAKEPAGPTISQLQRECGAHSKTFVEYWPCMRVGLNYPDDFPDIKALYLATGDYVAEQVRDGKMTDADAKLAMAGARQKAASELHARSTADANVRAARYAAWSATRPVTCVRSGYVVNCY